MYTEVVVNVIGFFEEWAEILYEAYIYALYFSFLFVFFSKFANVEFWKAHWYDYLWLPSDITPLRENCKA